MCPACFSQPGLFTTPTIDYLTVPRHLPYPSGRLITGSPVCPSGRLLPRSLVAALQWSPNAASDTTLHSRTRTRPSPLSPSHHTQTQVQTQAPSRRHSPSVLLYLEVVDTPPLLASILLPVTPTPSPAPSCSRIRSETIIVLPAPAPALAPHLLLTLSLPLLPRAMVPALPLTSSLLLRLALKISHGFPPTL